MYTREELYYFAHKAFELALECIKADEVPVGAVVVKDKQIIGFGRNRIVGMHDLTAHAEMLAMQEAAAHLQNERLINCDLFTTLEPCTMCSGALLFARIRTVYYLADEIKLPALRKVMQLSGHNHTPKVERLTLDTLDAASLLRDYFKSKR